ncbi:MAG TPA: alcohol dehydrogenase [Phycisphaerales bacterium]|nr:alcohol dehydrogenase [Phycisphaerales bacterium]
MRMSTFVAAAVGVLLTAGLCPAADWPQFMGPDRNGKSAETGLLKSWPTGGPRLLWSADGHGIGYGSAAVADGAVYLTGMVGNEGVLFCYDTGGNLRYKVPYGPEWTRSYKGARATPTVDGPRLYIFSGMGVLSCHDVKTGERIWTVDTLKKFEGNNIRWGMVCSPLIDGDKVYVTPGGRKGLMAALDKRTGETIWATSGYEENPAYSSPMLVEHEGGRLLVTMMEKLVIGVDAGTGALRWQYPYPASYGTSAVTPVVGRIPRDEGRGMTDASIVHRPSSVGIFVANVVEHEYVLGGTQLRLAADGGGVEKAWNQPVLDTHHGGLVLVDGFLYGSTFESTTKGSWACVEWDTGKLMYDADWNGNKGSLVYADGMLYCYEEETGNLALVRATPEKFDIVGSFTITRGSGKHWAHPSIADGVLYIRHGEVLMAFDINKMFQ